MKIHILGICGTFMAGIAQIAKQAGHEVSGSDINNYPPMSTQLSQMGIEIKDGYEASNIEPDIDCVIVGNVIRRGNPAIEYVLSNRIPYFSGPEWLANYILKDRWVLAVSGTHGKTTTTSMLAWILDAAGLNPGFLIGGVPTNFGISARIGSEPFFVIEADEYDSAFFDKRSKFIHYRPKTLILNNLEFDHADIFPDLQAIQQQFHYLVRTVPGNGLISYAADDENLKVVLEKGVWTGTTTFGNNKSDWHAELLADDGSYFAVFHHEEKVGEVKWELLGNHNVSNALAAISAANHAGVSPEKACKVLSLFQNVKRRLEIKGVARGITVYDDFAHHPTAIATTLAGLRSKVKKDRIVVVLEFGSYTMRSGVHKTSLKEALKTADKIICKKPVGDWGLAEVLGKFTQPTALYEGIDGIINDLSHDLKNGDHVVVMSNSGFDGIHQKILDSIG